jgi:HD-GYP domain-containing protein (c-di-GMP phosphodiesterase class II)
VKLLEVTELAEGQRYSEPVFLDGDNVLVPAHIPLRKKDLDLLASLGIGAVYTDGFLIAGSAPPAEAFVFNHSTEKKTEKGGAATGYSPEIIFNKLTSMVQQLDKIFNEVANAPAQKRNRLSLSVSIRQLWALVSGLLVLVKAERAGCLSFILRGMEKSYEIARRSINTAIMSIITARELKLDTHKIPEIASGAILHDIGMLRLPRDIVYKQGKLSAEETLLIKSHTVQSYQIITKELAYSPAVAAIALQHHEHWDGSGYPHKLVGNAIDVGARIVCIADAFEAMVSEKPYRESMIAYLAMKNLVSANATQFAPAALKAFIKVVGIYPIGSGVTLNDGRIARVIDVQPEVPLRPRIKILAETGAHRVENGEEIDLSNNKNLFITQALDISNF